MSELNRRLGFDTDDRLVIVTCDNLGRSHAANVAVYDALRQGIATNAALMVPCPWARHAATGYRGEAVGVHLTLNAELDDYRWGPLTMSPSLLDGDGGFPRTPLDLWDHADLDEVRRECRAQVERAVLWGFRVTHLDSHLGSLIRRPEFFDVYLDLALDFSLPIRLDDADDQNAVGFPFRRLAAEEGVLSPDHVRHLRAGAGARQAMEDVLFGLESGVTEICIQPAVASPELQAIDPDWSRRVEEYQALTADASLRDLLQRTATATISYAELRQAQNRKV